jgi:hypothetical protein
MLSGLTVVKSPERLKSAEKGEPKADSWEIA